MFLFDIIVEQKVGERKHWLFSYLDYLREKTLAIIHHFTNFAMFSPTNIFRYTVSYLHYYEYNDVMFSGCVDVNVIPDKRQILIQRERALLTVTKASLICST